ncbi:hypothetical protein [cf. Phormidesmis sp. LEGE 11477]|uniref:hypothetical protein n=1 Tax=cf. Phormidesmis sp. LEGE 11477 TaxID=1828680 RepID=UPI00188302B7|nr:hypothetical protein [cf. Phormidesmis sp. LEGE 11477]MBE9064262.1 hypothetical protein [cf. Phormidesmis sp. LEGE 11477]
MQATPSLPLEPPVDSFEQAAEAYAQTFEAEAVSYEDETLSQPVTEIIDKAKKKKRKPFPTVRWISLGRGSLLKLSLPGEFFIYSMIWAVISLLKYEIPEENYQLIETATRPVVVWLILMLLFIISAARQASALDKLKALVLDFPRMGDASSELQDIWEQQCSLTEQANTVLAATLSYFLVYIILA